MEPNYKNPKCDVCCDTREVPEWQSTKSTGVYTFKRWIRCPYCAEKREGDDPWTSSSAERTESAR